MADVHDAATRSYNMSRIKGRDTKPELIVRKLTHSLGLRFRLQNKKLPGKPDLSFRKHHVVLFVHGCFWHSHTCKYGQVTPKTNAEFWREKRARTVQRDKQNLIDLEKLGWRHLIVWECETRDLAKLKDRVGDYFKLSPYLG